MYPFVSETEFERISTAIRNLIKNSCLDRFTSALDVYRMSLGIEPRHIALKQLVLIGLKRIDPISVKNNRYLIHIPSNNVNKPCLHTAYTTFNSYTLEMRKKIIDYLVNQLESSVEKLNYDVVKSTIKSHYSDELFTINGSVIKGKKARKDFIYKLVDKNKYSRQKVRDRIEKSIAAKENDNSLEMVSNNSSIDVSHDNIDGFTVKHVRKK